MVTPRYKVVFEAIQNEWQVIDTMPHLMRDAPDEVVNSYHRDAKDRAEEVAADMNRHDQRKRGVLILTEDDVVEEAK